MASESVQIGRARHRRILILINVGCAKYVRALIETHVKDLRPPSNLDEFLKQNKDKIDSNRKLNFREKNLLYPPINSCTDINKWDLTLLTMIYLNHCNPSSSSLKMDMRFLTDRRNTLSHSTTCTLSDEEYTTYLEDIEVISERCLKKIDNKQLTDEVNACLKDENTFCLDRLRELIIDLEKKLPVDQEDANQNNLLSEILDILKQLYPERNDGKIPDIRLIIELKNYDGEIKPEIKEKIIENIKPSNNYTSTVNMETVNKWLRKDVEIISAESDCNCVCLTLRCYSVQDLATLWQKNVRRHITESVQSLQTALRMNIGCEHVVVEVNLPAYEIWRCINVQVGHMFDARTSDSETDMTRFDDIDNSSFNTELDCPEADPYNITYAGKDIFVELNVKVDSFHHMKHLVDGCKSGTINNSFINIGRTLKNNLSLEDLSIDVSVDTKAILEQIKDIKLFIKVKNVRGEKEKDISEKILEYIIPKCDEIPTEHMDTIEKAVHYAVNKWLSEGVEVVSAERKCVLLTLRCHSAQGLATLWQDFVKGQITERFQPLQTTLRMIPGCENVVVEVDLPEYGIRRCIDALVVGLAAPDCSTYKARLDSGKNAHTTESKNTETVLCKREGMFAIQASASETDNVHLDILKHSSELDILERDQYNISQDDGSREFASKPDIERFNELDIFELNINRTTPKTVQRMTRFGADFQGRKSHTALLHIQDIEIKLLESIKACLLKRLEGDRHYLLFLTSFVQEAMKMEVTEYHSYCSVFKAWMTVIKGSEQLVELLQNSIDGLSTNVMEKITSIISDKRSARKSYEDERNRLEKEFNQIKDEVQNNKQEYQKCVDKVREDRANYEDLNVKGWRGIKHSIVSLVSGKGDTKAESAKQNYVQSSMKLHKAHNRPPSSQSGDVGPTMETKRQMQEPVPGISAMPDKSITSYSHVIVTGPEQKTSRLMQEQASGSSAMPDKSNASYYNVIIKGPEEETNRLMLEPVLCNSAMPDKSNASYYNVKETGHEKTGTGSKKKLEYEEWFHGVLPRDEAEQILARDGDFLVRESKTKITNETKYVLSAYWQGYRHFKIDYHDNGWRFEGSCFPTITELVNHQCHGGQPVTKTSGTILSNPILRESVELLNDDIALEIKIGNGSFGEVFKGIYKHTHEAVAVKTCKDTLSDDQKKKYLMEGRILKQHKHPNIVRFIGIAAQRQPIMVIMEYVSGGTLLSFLKKEGKKQTRLKAAQMCLDAACGMAYLSEKGCIHRDLATRNCLVGHMNLVKISVFGMSREEEVYTVSDDTKPTRIKWTAPEALNYGKYTIKSDVWSYGILMWEIFSNGQVPYHGWTNSIARFCVEEQGYRMHATAGTPESVYKLMLKCWDHNAQTRINFQDLYTQIKNLIDNPPKEESWG